MKTDQEKKNQWKSVFSVSSVFSLERENDEKRIFELASTGFESTVRLAKSSPETWSQIFHQNQENLLDVLDEYINTLLKYKGLMLAGSYDKLKDELSKANDIGRILNNKKGL